MTVTVADILQMPALAEAHVLVGAEGLRRPVRFIDVIEVPDIVDWAKAETVYMTTTYPFMGNPELFIKTVRGFAEHEVSALMIKVGRFIEEVPPEVYQVANEYRLPIIVLPTDAAYSPIITAIGRKLAEDAVDGVGNYMDIAFQQKIQQILLNDGGVQALAELLADRLNGEVFVENAVGQLMFSAGEETSINLYQSHKWLEQEAVYFREMACYQDYYYTVLIMPTYLGEELQGNIIVSLKGMVESYEAQYGPIKSMAQVIALELSRAKAVYERRIHLEQALLEGIIEHHEALDEAVVQQQVSALGWEYSTMQMMAVFNVGRREDFNDRQKLEQYIQKLSYRLSTWLKQEAFKGIFCRKNDNLVCLFSMNKQVQEPAEVLSQWGEAFLAEIRQDFAELVVSMGLSRPVSRIAELGEAYGDAQKAVRMGKRAYGGGQVYDYQRMGVYRLLFTHKDIDSQVEFYEDYLKPLVQYDQKHDSELVHTIEAYYQNNANTLATAEQLYIHRNTLNYRLKRASDILGFDIDDVDRKLCVSLALQIKKLLNL